MSILGRYSDFGELTTAGIDTWINSDSSLNAKVMAADSIMQRKQSTDEDDTKKRKRGRRGGRRRGSDQPRKFRSGGLKSGKQASSNWRGNLQKKEPKKQGASNTAPLSNLPDGILFVEDASYKGYHCAFCNCSLNSLTTMRRHRAGFRHQTNRRIRKLEQKKKRGANASNSESENSTREVAPLSKLPDGILLIEDGSYVGYHCTYCNCALKYTSSIDTHLAGFRHQLMIEARIRIEEQKKAEVDGEKCKKSVVKNEEKDEKQVGVLLKDSTSRASVPKEKDEKDVESLLENSTSKTSASLVSSLEDALAAVSEPVIGLDYITKKQKQDEEPSYECSLCSVISEVDDMKAHILGTRHRLMYMKKTDPKKIAELMAKNLPKGERNKEIREYIASAMEKYGKGSMVVENSEASLPKAPQRKDDQKTSDKPRKSFDAVGSAQHKRVNEEENSSKKKRHCDELNHRRDISKETYTGRDNRSNSDSYSSFNQQSYDYNRQSSGSDKGRLFEPSFPSRQNKEGPASDPPKLPDIEVTNEEEAGIVMNVISSLTERFLHYKLKNISNTARETLEKSLKGENLLHALTLLSGQNNARATDKPPILPKGGEVPQPQPAYKKRTDAAAVKSMTESYQDRTQKTEIPSLLSLQFDWNKSKDAMYSKERKYTYSEFAKYKDVMEHSQYEWNKVGEGKSTDSAIPSSHGWDNTKDGRSRELMAQIPSSWDERDTRSDKGMTDYQLKQRWSDIRGNVPVYSEGTMSDSDWNRTGNTTGIKETRSSTLESKRSSYSLNQFPLSWNEARLSSNIQNKDSLPKASYSFDKSEGTSSLRSTAPFSQQQQNWSVDGQSQAQQVWNRTDQYIARSGTDRPIGQSVMDRDNSIYGRGSTSSITSQLLQSNMGSLAQRRDVSHHTNVDDLLDKYEKKLQSEKSRNSLTAISPGYHSYATPTLTTPTLTTRSHYLGPSTPSSFNRPSSFGQLESTSNFLRWK